MMARSLAVAAALMVAVTAAWFAVGPGRSAPTGACTDASRMGLPPADPGLETPALAWHATELPEGIDDANEQVLLDVAVFHDIFIAVGRSSNGPDWHTFFLRSPDGVHWEADGADEQRFAGTELTDLSIAGDRLFAIGSTSTDDRGGSRGAVWFTDDGRSWTEATGSLSDRWLTSLSGGDDGLLLIGAANGGGGPVAWRSDDGTAWEEQPLELPVARSHAGFGAVAALGDGWHAAGWVSRAPDGPAAPVIWRSGDGVSWSCHLLDAGGYSRAEARSLHQAGAAWLATGSAAEGCGPAASCIGYPIGWVSDSLTWSEALLDGEPASLGGTAIASAGDMFVAVSHGRTFVSSDGFHWTSVGEDGWDGQVDALVVRDDGRLVGVGTIYTGSDAGPVIVTGDLAP